MAFDGSEIYYRIAGERTEKAPLIALHGGPGASHGYLIALDDLAEEGREVIYYDQIGCGRSTAPSDPSRWVPPLFLEELQALVRHLDLKEHHVFGNSWGGMLAILYAATQPQMLKSVLLSSTPISIPMWNAESARMLREAPDDVRLPLERGEATGERDTPQYQKALDLFYADHICNDMPGFVTDALENLGEVYHTMQGFSELFVTGSLKDCDLTDKLPLVQVPTLVTSGKRDQCTAAVVESTLQGIPNSRALLFENSAHMAFVEERQLFMKEAEAFLASCD